MYFTLLACLCLLDAALPRGGDMWISDPSSAQLAELVEGRARLCLVREGMSEAQVTCLLGRPTIHSVRVNGRAATLLYSHFGVRVSLPLTCGPSDLRCSSSSASAGQPASSSASTRTARRSGSRWPEGRRRSSYAAFARRGTAPPLHARTV
jgi:hypothetical protein